MKSDKFVFSEVRKKSPQKKNNQNSKANNTNLLIKSRFESSEMSHDESRHFMIDPSLSSSESFDFKTNNKWVPAIR